MTRRLAGWLALAVVLGVGVAGLGLAMQSLRPQYVYGKDFIQEYMLARAIRAGMNPYLPQKELAKAFGVETTDPIFPHPTPHPPGLALFSWPLAWFDYPLAAAAWMALELCCLVLGVGLLARWYEPSARWTTIAIASLAATGSQVVWRDLFLGQSGTLLFALLALAWTWMRSGRELKGGCALGLAIALKLTAWPVMVALVAARRWTGILAGVGLIAAVHLAAVVVMGPWIVSGYYRQVAPMVADLYRASFINLSPATLGWRLFDGTGSPDAAVGFVAPPLVALPWLAPTIGYAAMVSVLAVAVWELHRLDDFDARFGVMTAAILMVSPIVWDHYLLIAAIPGVIIAANLRSLGYPRGMRRVAMVAAVLVVLPGVWGHTVPAWFARLDSRGEQVVPAPVSLLGLMPSVGVLAGLVLCAATSREVGRRGIVVSP